MEARFDSDHRAFDRWWSHLSGRMAIKAVQIWIRKAFSLVPTNALTFEVLLDPFKEQLSGKGLARCLTPARFQPLPIRTAREVFPQAAHPVSFIERVMGRVG